MRAAVLPVIAVLALDASPASAQAAAAAGRLEVAAGALWTGRANLGGGAANETTSTGGAVRLFSSSTSVASVARFRARGGYVLTRRLEVDGAVAFIAPDLRVSVANDAEGASSVTASERLQQFTFGGDVLWSIASGGLMAPFVEAGAGYLRLLHEGRTLLDT